MQLRKLLWWLLIKHCLKNGDHIKRWTQSGITSNSRAVNICKRQTSRAVGTCRHSLLYIPLPPALTHTNQTGWQVCTHRTTPISVGTRKHSPTTPVPHLPLSLTPTRQADTGVCAQDHTHLTPIKIRHKPVSQSCAVAKSGKFWRATGQSTDAYKQLMHQKLPKFGFHTHTTAPCPPFAKFDCQVARQNIPLLATMHDCETGLCYWLDC